VVAVILAVAWLAGWSAAIARADGDPASDVLASQSLFLPQDAGVPAAQHQRLTELLRSASAAGFPIRVALIASPTDLGSISELWRRPQSYARFLGQELGLVYHGLLLVVMPDGYGGAEVGAAGGSRGGRGISSASFSGLPVPGSGPGLAMAALTAVEHLAATAGHTLPSPAARTGTGAAGGSVDVAAWLALAAGALLIVAAWVASLRARPLRADGRADATC
jgi:hypothetical protein